MEMTHVKFPLLNSDIPAPLKLGWFGYTRPSQTWVTRIYPPLSNFVCWGIIMQNQTHLYNFLRTCINNTLYINYIIFIKYLLPPTVPIICCYYESWYVICKRQNKSLLFNFLFYDNLIEIYWSIFKHWKQIHHILIMSKMFHTNLHKQTCLTSLTIM